VETPPGVVADYIRKTNHILVTSDNEELLLYKDGVYLRDARNIIKDWAKELLGASFSTAMWREIEHHIKSSGHVDRDIMDTDKEVLNVANGLLNMRTRILSPHNPKTLSTVQLPIVYSPDATCPRIDKFLSEVLSPQDIPLVLEFFGYCLWRDYPIQNWLLLDGQGANGKGTLIRLLTAFVGVANVAGNSLQVLVGREFSLADLYRRLVNTCADLPARGISDTGIIKQLTGGDLIRGEFKYSKPFYFYNYAKLIFSTNTPPKVSGDDSYGFWRRLIMVTFPNAFAGDDADPYLDAVLSTPGELSGLLNLALDGLANLLDRGKFSRDANWRQTQSAYQLKSEPIPVFVDDKCELGLDLWDSAESLYFGYLSFCEWGGVFPKSRVWFFRELNACCPGRIVTRRKAGVTGYSGIALRRPNLSAVSVSLRPSSFTDDAEVEQND
tara:strand:+ start:1275 stop:2594 length:1320 start_codon:yes stop_codon:yes gene_type:complete